MAENKLLKAALWYATEKGWPVLPLHSIRTGVCTCGKGKGCDKPGKHPRWAKDTLEHGAKSATTDPEVITSWWTRWPNANVGIATGAKTFDVLDIDLKGEGPDTLADLEAKHGRLPDTIEQITGSGGRQVMFQPCGKIGNAVRFAEGLDTRSDGGLVVVPPSMHISGNRYQWEASSRPDEKELTPFPEWLVQIINGGKTSNGNGDREPVDVRAIFEGIEEGRRDQEIYRYACRLRSQGMSRREAELLVLDAAARCKPPFPNEEALRKVQQAWKHSAPEFAEVSSAEDDHEPDILQWPILPDEALYGLAGDFVRLATRNSEADPAAVLITFLVRFCAEVGNGPFLMVGDSKHYARLFAAIVGDTSKARKGTSYGPVARCFEGITSFCSFTSSNKYVCARSTPGPLSSGEGIIYAVRDPIQKTTWDKKTREVSVEIVDPGVNDKRLFICDEELGGALSCTKREGNTLSTVLRCAWDHGNQDPLTKTSKIAASGAHIGIVGHITLTELKRKLEDSEAFNGFANRFLWVCARRNGCVPFPEPMPDGELREIQRRLFDTITFAQSVGQMCLTDEAKALWREIYPELSADHDGLVGAVINRAEAQVLRLAMVYALIDRSNNINNLHINKCITMYEYCKQSAQYIFHGFEADPVSDRIMKRVRDLGEMEWMDLYALFSNNLSKQGIDTAVNDLLRKGKLAVETLKTGDRGRPKRILRAKHSHTHNSDEQNEVNEVIPDRAIRGYLIDLQRGAVGDPEVRAACIRAGYLDDQGRFTQAGFDFVYGKENDHDMGTAC